MPPNPSQVVEVFVRVTEGEVSAASSLAAKGHARSLSPFGLTLADHVVTGFYI